MISWQSMLMESRRRAKTSKRSAISSNTSTAYVRKPGDSSEFAVVSRTRGHKPLGIRTRHVPSIPAPALIPHILARREDCMHMPSRFCVRGKQPRPIHILAGLLMLLVILSSTPGYAIPAFARKYGLPCSACHEAWPKLNSFGQNFKD